MVIVGEIVVSSYCIRRDSPNGSQRVPRRRTCEVLSNFGTQN